MLRKTVPDPYSGDWKGSVEGSYSTVRFNGDYDDPTTVS